MNVLIEEISYMLRVVVLDGVPESRHTFKQICRDKLQSLQYMTVNFSYLDLAKDFASRCGWQDRHTPEDEKFIEDIQRALIVWNDAVLKDLIVDVDAYHYTGMPTVVFIDVLDFTEVDKVKKAFNATTAIVRRPQKEIDHYGTSYDRARSSVKWDYIIWHDGDRLQLSEEVDNFIVELLSNPNNVYRAEESYYE
jgi:hypothetical protein